MKQIQSFLVFDFSYWDSRLFNLISNFNIILIIIIVGKAFDNNLELIINLQLRFGTLLV